MDGAFMELDSESISNEADDYWRDIYKTTKTFLAQKKKRDAEKAKAAPPKKKRIGAEEGEAPEEKKEEEEEGGAALKVCNTVQEQIKEFQVDHWIFF